MFRQGAQYIQYYAITRAAKKKTAMRVSGVASVMFARERTLSVGAHQIPRSSYQFDDLTVHKERQGVQNGPDWTHKRLSF